MEIITILLKLKLTKQAKVDVIIKQVNIKRVRAKKNRNLTFHFYVWLFKWVSYFTRYTIFYIYTRHSSSLLCRITLSGKWLNFFLSFFPCFSPSKKRFPLKKEERKESIKFHVLKSRKPRYQITFTVEWWRSEWPSAYTSHNNLELLGFHGVITMNCLFFFNFIVDVLI